jgi:hypothetical protein
MKFVFFIFLILLPCSFLYSEKIVIVPELIWWLTEVQSINKHVNIDKFTLLSSKKEKIHTIEMDKKYLYPIFMRWNYSGNKIGYFNLGLYLENYKGKYKITSDIDSSLLILDSNYQILFREAFGSISGVDAIAWIKDDILMSVGIEINNSNTIDLLIKYYFIGDLYVEQVTYIYKNAFSNDDRLKLKLNWTEHRNDLFW